MEENCSNCCNCADAKLKEETLEMAQKFENHKENLIAILNDVQEKYGYVPTTAQKVVAEYLNIPLADVYGVVTFYSRFTTVPKGKYDISVCMGPACFVKGSQSILERAKETLGIDEGQTTEDQLFSLETMRCVGACGLAPVFTVNNKVYGKATVKKLDEVIDELKANGGN